MRRHALALTLTFVLSPACAWAFSISMTPYGNVVRWNTPNLTYYLDPNGAPGINDGSDIAAIKQSFADWQTVSCSALTFEYLGSTYNKNVLPITGEMNGKNELVYITDSSWQFGQYTLGVTVPLYYYDGQIVESDIAFNGYLASWTTNPNGWQVDVKSVAIHEIGHFLGLQHVLYGYDPNDPPTMAPGADPWGKTATLSQDDINGACFLYPDPNYYPSGYYTCSGEADCPYVLSQDQYGNESYSKKIKCSGGYCSGAAGVSPHSVGLGGTCNSYSDCKSPYACEQLDSGMKVCTSQCDLYNDQCPSGYHCQQQYSTGKNVCTPGSKKKKEGEPCNTSYECATSFCFPTPDGSGSFCRVACTKGGAPCPSGKVCWTSAYSNTGGCFPASEVPNDKKPVGAACSGDKECESGICFMAQCRAPCSNQDAMCDPSHYCGKVDDTRLACLPGQPPPKKKEDGALCTENEECTSNWCVPFIASDQSFCRRPCNLKDWACPWGTSCVSYGSPDYGVCMPSVGKQGTGGPCEGPADCVSGICIGPDVTGAKYCSQNCIQGWCPQGMVCGDAGYFGAVCFFPSQQGEDSSGQGGEDVSVPPVNPDTGGPTSDLGPTPPPSNDNGADTGTMADQGLAEGTSSGGGCVASRVGMHRSGLGLTLLWLFVSVIWRGRRRIRFS